MRNFLGVLIFGCLVAFNNSATAQNIDAESIFRSAAPSVVLIIASDEYGQPLSLGSGFFVDGKGTLVTNFHVIEGASDLKIQLIGEESVFNVEGVFDWDAYRDLVLLKVETDSSKALVLTTSTPKVGEKVIAIGNPLGLEGTISEGIVSGIRKDEEFTVYQITAPISPGSSGGPVINGKGEVIGIATASLESGQNLNFAIPASYLDSMYQNMGQLKMLSIAANAKSNKVSKISTSVEAVTVVDYYIDKPALSFSIHNGNQYSIRNVILLALFWKRSTGVPVHFMPIEVDKIIPPNLSLRYQVWDSMLEGYGQFNQVWSVTFRVLDYEAEW